MGTPINLIHKALVKVVAKAWHLVFQITIKNLYLGLFGVSKVYLVEFVFVSLAPPKNLVVFGFCNAILKKFGNIWIWVFYPKKYQILFVRVDPPIDTFLPLDIMVITQHYKKQCQRHGSITSLSNIDIFTWTTLRTLLLLIKSTLFWK